MKLPNYILFVLERLKDYEAYVVGGSVRDYLLKREINDYDITHVFAMKDEHLDNYMHNNGIGNLLYEDEYFTVYEIR